ncbi:ElyC/SanA/YdcF family protein, partial [Thermodesulfobacteriota bacterium]
MPIRLLKKKTVTVPTVAGWLLLAALLCAGAYCALRGLYPFLSFSSPVGAEILVVEGWLSEKNLQQVLQVYKKGAYDEIIVTGGPVLYKTMHQRFDTYADLTASRLVSFGVPREQVTALPAPSAKKNRTFTSAMVLKNHFVAHGRKPSALDICTRGPHARRTRYLFQLALSDDCAVGAIGIDPAEYDGRRWWTASEGI